MDTKERQKTVEAVIEFNDRWTYSRMVTLQFNDWRNTRLPEKGRDEHIREALRDWDAFVSRKMLGRYWQSNPDRIFCFFVPEKVTNSPHWHGLVRFPTKDPAWKTKQEEAFDKAVPGCWSKVAPYGSCQVDKIFDQVGAEQYLAKTLHYDVSYEHFVIPDEFHRG